MKALINLTLIFFISNPIISQSQILSNTLKSSTDSVKIDWGIEEHEFSDALIYVAQNISNFDKTVTLSIETKWNSNDKVFRLSQMQFDVPKNSIVSNIMNDCKTLSISDSQYLLKNDLRLEVNIKSITNKE